MRSVTLMLVVVAVLLPQAASAMPAVRNIAAPTEAGLYDKFEATFEVDTTAANPYWPYDASPAANTAEHPNAVPAGVGVSVDGLLLPPGEADWNRAVVQPGFYFQDFELGNYAVQSYNDWLYPKNSPCWKIRFAPTQVGQWQFRIRVTDADGTTTSPDHSFDCTPSSNHGFARVSPTDDRYFETSDGTYMNFVGQGYHDPRVYLMDDAFRALGANGVNLLRVMWNPGEGPVVFGVYGDGGMPGWANVHLTADAARPGQLFSGVILQNETVTTSVDVEPASVYRYSLWVKTVGFVGDAGYGVRLEAYPITDAGPVSPTISGDHDWTELAGTFTTSPTARVISHLKIVVSGMTAGRVYYTDISVRKSLGNGQYGPELMSRTDFNAHKYIAQKEAWKADYQVECAKRNAVYLKICLQEKNDRVFCRIQADGTVGESNNGNIYADATHACRVYQQYIYRYIIARYGYATSIHSFEFLNEGDPLATAHWRGADAFVRYFHDNAPNRNLATTSLWNNFIDHMWKDPGYATDYADIHQYISVGGGLQSVDGWWPSDKLDGSAYRSPSTSLHVIDPTGRGVEIHGDRFKIVPGHAYRTTVYVKARDFRKAVSDGPAPFLGMFIGFCTKYDQGLKTPFWVPMPEPEGTYDWKAWQIDETAGDDTPWMMVGPRLNDALGEAWYDDITVYDLTAGKYVDVPAGDFDNVRLDYDSALTTYSVGRKAGPRGNRSIPKPLVRGEVGICGANSYGTPYKGFSHTGENQGIVDDDEGVWYRKFTWGQINHYGVIEVYWWNANQLAKGLYKYAKAYQSFMAGIPLSNGHYTDVEAVASDRRIRAWGQKDTANGRAHLWIDNAPYTWKAVVDHNRVDLPWNSTATYALDSTCASGDGSTLYRSLQNSNKDHPLSDTAWWVAAGPPPAKPPLPPAVSGTVTVAGFADGAYAVEWWDTTTGQITNTQNVDCVGGLITLPVQNLTSDMACKISAAPARMTLRILVPSENVAPGDVVTVTVEYTNEGNTDARNVLVSARVPAEMDYVPGSAEETQGVYDPVTKMVAWTIESVPPHQPGQPSGTRTFRARVR